MFHLVTCRIGAFSVCLRSELAQVAEDFAALYPNAPTKAATDDQTIHIEVRRSGRSRLGRRLYRVYADGEEIGGWRPSSGVFPFVEWGINLRMIARRSEYLQIHAASMTRSGRGFVFAGESGCGKSTLAAILMARGWGYLCDEFALVEPDTLRLQPFPKALCIKAGSYRTIRRLGLPFGRRRDYIKQYKGRVGYIRPAPLGEAGVARFIIFPNYRQGAPPRLQPISRARAVMDLYRCCFNKTAFSDAALPALTKLVRQCDCYRLDVGDPGETCRLLDSLVRQRADVMPVTSTSERVLQRPSKPDRPALRSRREVLRLGTKLAYVAPAVVFLSRQQAFAATSIPSGLCSTLVQNGGLCETDTDCCTGNCNLGVCSSS